MSNNRQTQYIGARYVIKIYENSTDTSSAEWEANVNYEPLTLVTYNYGTYLSKINVPASIGNPATNKTYWSQTGFYNGQIASLQNQIDNLDTALDNAVDEINDTYNVRTQPCLFVGDSYGIGSINFIDRTISKLGMTNAHNLSVSGSGFTLANSFLNQIQNYAGNRDEIRAIYVLGGLNDSTPANKNTTPNNITNHMDAFAEYAHANYPNAKLYCGYIGNAKDDATLLDYRTLEYRQFACYMYSANNLYTFFDMSTVLSVNTALMADDGIHPSTAGQVALAKALSNFIISGYYKPTYPKWECTLTPETGWAKAETASTKMHYQIHGDVAKIMFNDGFGFNPTADTTIDNNYTKMATFNNLYFNAPYEIGGVFRLDGGYNGGNNFQDHYLKMKFEGNSIYIASDEINSNGTGFNSFTGHGAIRLKGVTDMIVDTIDLV